MRHIRVLVCQVDDGTPDLMTELACFDLPTPDVATLQPETALDALEATTQEIGMAILRRLLHAQWDEIDAALVAQHCAQMAPAVVQQDGHETVTVASRFGLLHLARQVCVDPRTQCHILPGNAVLPPHAGIIITRGLQEWCCLLPQELSFAPVARLLGWQTQEEKVLSCHDDPQSGAHPWPDHPPGRAGRGGGPAGSVTTWRRCGPSCCPSQSRGGGPGGPKS